MNSTILVAIIGGIAAITAAIIGAQASRSKNKVIEKLKRELALYGDSNNTPAFTSADFGIEILEPRDLEAVERSFEVRGRYEFLPEGWQIYLSTFELDRDGNINNYWPQSIAKTADGRWEGKIRNIGRAKSGDKREFLALAVGKDGQALFQYFGKVVETTRHWPGINKITGDTIYGVKGSVKAIKDFLDY